MKQHSMACEFPEGCSCGATEWNALEDEVKRLRDALGVIARNVDAGAVHISWCSDYAKRVLANAELSGGEAIRSDDLFGLRVVGHEAPLPHFFATEAEAKELRMRHRDHSPACLEVVRITVKPNDKAQF